MAGFLKSGGLALGVPFLGSHTKDEFFGVYRGTANLVVVQPVNLMRLVCSTVGASQQLELGISG